MSVTLLLLHPPALIWIGPGVHWQLSLLRNLSAKHGMVLVSALQWSWTSLSLFLLYLAKWLHLKNSVDGLVFGGAYHKSNLVSVDVWVHPDLNKEQAPALVVSLPNVKSIQSRDSMHFYLQFCIEYTESECVDITLSECSWHPLFSNFLPNELNLHAFGPNADG